MLNTLRVLVGAMMGALVFIGIALFFVLAPEEREPGPPVVVLLGVVLLAVVLFVLIETLGYRVPKDPNAVTSPATAFQAMTLLRAALGESVAIVSVALAFLVTSGGLIVYLLGAVLGLGLLAWHAFPWSRPIRRSSEALRRAGVTPDLESVLGLPSRPTGPIQEL